LEVIARKPLAA